MSEPDWLAGFERERRHLLAVAFRLLGSDADAQDVLQEAWIRYQRADRHSVHNIGAWLTTLVTRMCLDVLRKRHEYPEDPQALSAWEGGEGPDEVALMAAELIEAFTVILQRLTPPQRVALILHDAFGTPFSEVAGILDTTPAGAKKLASRARGRVRESGRSVEVDPARAHRVVAEFLRAAQEGDFDGLVAVLHPEVTRTADPQVLPTQAALQLRGSQTVATETRTFQANARRAQVATIDGRPGIIVASRGGREVRGDLLAALVFIVVDDRIIHYDVVADPQRLAMLRIED